jgi:oligosaccharide repeat unit polymerase
MIAIDTVFLFSIGALWVAFATLVMAVMVRNYFRPVNAKRLVVGGLFLATIVTASVGLKHGLVSLENADDSESVQIFDLVGQRFSSGAATLQVALDTFPKVASYQYGATYVRDVVGLVPSPVKRQFFPESWWGGFNGYFFGLMFGFSGGTTQIPIIGEFYANFGLIGIFVCSVLYGAFLQHLSNVVRQRSVRRLSSVVLIVALGYRFAEATVEGMGDRFMVSCVWAVIFVVAYYWYPLRGHASPAPTGTSKSSLAEQAAASA